MRMIFLQRSELEEIYVEVNFYMVIIVYLLFRVSSGQAVGVLFECWTITPAFLYIKSYMDWNCEYGFWKTETWNGTKIQRFF